MVHANDLVKYIRCLAKARGDLLGAAEICRKDFGAVPALSLIQRAIISTDDLGGDAAWRASASEFLAGVAVYDVLMRINALSPLHTVPVRTRVLAEDEEPVAVWVSEGEVKTASGASFKQLTIVPQKAAGLIVVTKDLVFLTADGAENALTRSLKRSVAKITSAAAFASAPDDSAPASLLTNAIEVPSTGDVKADMTELVSLFQGDIERAVLVMSSNTAMTLALQGAMVGAAGGFGVRGGTFCGLPTVASADVDDSVVALVDPAQIAYGDDGIRLDTATEADVTIDGVQHNLWQENLVGILAERYVSWKATDDAVAYLSGVDWSGSAA